MKYEKKDKIKEVEKIRDNITVKIIKVLLDERERKDNIS